MILDTYRLLYDDNDVTIANLDEMAEELSRLAGREQQWTGKFLHSLIKGYSGFRVSDQLSAALSRLATHGRAVRELPQWTIEALPPGTLLMYPPQRCATLGCHINFVPGAWNQKYHSKECCRLARQLRRKR